MADYERTLHDFNDVPTLVNATLGKGDSHLIGRREEVLEDVELLRMLTSGIACCMSP
jgi:hypothetical protein